MRIRLVKTRPRAFGVALYDERIHSTPEAKNACLERMLELLAVRRAVRNEEERTKVRLVLDELLVNAMEHGNRWEAPKRVHVRLEADRTQWAVRIEDWGQGFDPARVPDPTAPDALLRDSGRGLLLIDALMDRVRYYDGGRGVWAVRRIRPARLRRRGSGAARDQRIPGKRNG